MPSLSGETTAKVLHALNCREGEREALALVAQEAGLIRDPQGGWHPASYGGPRAAANVLGPSSRGSATSRQAAYENYPRSGSQRRRVLEAILAAGTVGATRDELAGTLGLPDSGTDARVWELLKGGHVLETDRTRPTRLGGAATVLVASSRGLPPQGTTVISSGAGLPPARAHGPAQRTGTAYDPMGDFA